MSSSILGIVHRQDLIPDPNNEQWRKSPIFPYLARVSQVSCGAGFLGLVIGYLGSTMTRVSAHAKAAQYSDQAGLNRATLSGFQETRYRAQRNIWSNALLSGAKLGVVAGLFSGMELGLSYCRGYWDAWNPLLAGTLTGAIYGIPLAGRRGLQMGLLFGGLAAMPVTAVEVAIRLCVGDDDLMPSTTIFSDPGEVDVGLELAIQLDKLKELESDLESQ